MIHHRRHIVVLTNRLGTSNYFGFGKLLETEGAKDEIDNATLSEVFYGIYFHENISPVLGSGKFFA
jgi:hypothetical protein